MTGLEILTIALGLALGGSVLLWRIPEPYCSHCVHCRHALAEKAEAKRKAAEKAAAERHQYFHKAYGIEWDSEHCPTCARNK